MPLWLHRTDKTLLRSVASADLPEAQANYIEEPDLSAVEGQPVRYWVVTNNVISLLSANARDAIDVALLSASKDATADQIDRVGSYSRAFALIMLDEINLLRANMDLSVRTAAQLKIAVRGKLNG